MHLKQYLVKTAKKQTCPTWMSETSMYFLYASTTIAFKMDIGAVTTWKYQQSERSKVLKLFSKSTSISSKIGKSTEILADRGRVI